VVLAIAFTTIAIGVNVRTSFSLLYPPILAEFGWDRGETAGIFSVGFATSMLISPFLGVAVNRFGPGLVFSTGALVVSAGLVLTTYADTQLLIYLSLGCGVVGGSIIFAFTSHAFLLPYWFQRRRGLTTGLAFSGVGVGAILMFPWLQDIIEAEGWRDACWTMAILLLAVVLPLNLVFQKRRPEDLGLRADGAGRRGPAAPALDNVVDAAWVARAFTLREALRTFRFWAVSSGLFFGMYIWYAVQVHQTKYLAEVGYSETLAAYALGMVALMGVGGQIGLGALSDRVGREWAWTIAASGFALCYILLLVMKGSPSPVLLWAMVASQGLLGYGLATIFPSILAELFHGPNYGRIFGVFSAIISVGAAAGPWITGEIYDMTGSYDLAWYVALAACGLAIGFVWLAAPRKVRLAAGVAAKRARAAGA
jgi:MFS family permease